MNTFSEFIKKIYENNKEKLPAANNPKINEIREKGYVRFMEQGLPDHTLENWRHYPIDRLVKPEYHIQFVPDPYRPVDEYFKCEIHNLGTNMFTLLNGWYVYQHTPLTIFPNGIIVGSLFAAIEQYPELVYPYLAQEDLSKTDSLVDLNNAFFNDGLFIYIPDNIIVEQPMQMVSLIQSSSDLLVQNRHLIIVGENSSLSFVHCNDSLKPGNTFTNNITEIYLAENATLNYCKQENKDADSLQLDHILVQQKSRSHFISNAITFNAGYVRNMLHVNLNEPSADAKLYGLYLADKKQVVDNQVFINHAATDCTSYQLYKGILDNESYANFNGHILVDKNSQRTAAYQTNRNITLTDEARITTRPFLEIYADDVQCSHGATVGQLDEEAMFYLRSRGICERNAKMLLMYAFANEVINHVDIKNLRSQLNDMVQKRLKGELHLCDQCLLHCADRNNFNFEIDISKI